MPAETDTGSSTDMAVQAAVEDYVATASAAAATQVLEYVNSARLDTLHLVQMLGPALAGQSSSPQRYNATELLGLVVNGAQTLPQRDGALVAEFMMERLRDDFSVGPAASALTALAGRADTMDSDLAIRVTEVTLNRVMVQSLPQEARQRVFGLMLALVRRFGSALRTQFGDAFAAGMARQVDQEKDPRCLLLAFEYVEAVARDFPLGPHTEDVFDVVACYFPISFTPPADDKVGIVQDDLLSALRKCFVATSEFAPHFFKLVFEAIAAPGDDCKIQCFETIGTCASAYPATELVPFASHMYSAARQEQFASFDEEIKVAALKALSGFTRALAAHPGGDVDSDDSEATTPLSNLLEPVVSEGIRHLSDFDMGFVKVQTRLMCACARAHPTAASYVCQQYLPAALSKRTDPSTDPDNRVVYMESIRDVVAATAELRAQHGQTCAATALGTTAPDVLAAVLDTQSAPSQDPATPTTKADQDPAAVSAALGCLAALLDTGAVGGKQAAESVAHAARCATDVTVSAAVQTAALQALRAVVRNDPVTGLEDVLPAVVNAEGGSSGGGGGGGGSERLALQIKALETLAVNQHSRAAILPLLFDQMATGQAPAQTVADAIATLCRAGAADHDEALAPMVLHRSLRLYLGTTPPPPAVTTVSVLETLATAALAMTAAAAPVSEQSALLSTAQSVLVGNDLSSLECPNRPAPYVSGAAAGGVVSGGDLVLFLNALVCALDVSLVTVDLCKSLRGALVKAVLDFDSVTAARAAAVALASLINKLESNDAVRDEVEAAVSALDAVVGREERSALGRAWITKAVVVRGHAVSRRLLDRILSDVATEATAMRAASMLGVVAGGGVSSDSDPLTLLMFPRTTLMHKQRLYAQTSGTLIAGYRQGTGVVRTAHLASLVHVLAAVPRQVLLNEVGTLWQLILEALGLGEDEQVTLCVLGLMQTLITEAKERVSENANSVVSALLPLCSAPRMRTRMAALDCLAATATLPPARIFPLVGEVIRGLIPVLDDRKRMVRHKAVECRAAWFLIGGTA
eukprot:m.82395 g.82395  ORF g.82395 m.82395 type:complete len:1037 (+) comp9462_c0_seq1:41-3151(+)